MSHLDEPGYTGMWFTIALYFPTSYRSEYVQTVLEGLAPLLIDEELSFQFERLRPQQATFARLSDTLLGGQPILNIRIGAPKLSQVLRARYLHVSKARLRKSRRPVTIMPMVDPENTVSIDVNLSLREGEEAFYAPSNLIEELGDERGFEAFLSQTDSLWSSMYVEATAATIGGLKTGFDHFADTGTFGSFFVNLIGRSEVMDALKRCQKVVYLPSGGVFFDWHWADTSVREEDHRAWRKKLMGWEKRIASVSEDLLEPGP